MRLNKKRIKSFCKKFSKFNVDIDIHIDIQYLSKENKNARGEAVHIPSWIDKNVKWIILYRKNLTKRNLFGVLAHEIGHLSIRERKYEKKNRSLHEAGAQIWAIKRAYELKDFQLLSSLLWEEKGWRTFDKRRVYYKASKICKPLLSIFRNGLSERDLLIIDEFLKNNFRESLPA